MHSATRPESCAARQPAVTLRRERGVRAVVLLTAVMMVVEIAVGYATRSMALLADGWHMATHVGALGIASAAYALARRFASHRAFAFGTGKVHALAGYTSAVALGLVALTMIGESTARLAHPTGIDFVNSLPVAVVGLAVNLLSVALLHEDHDDDADEHHHDHNHRAAVMHVIADTFTSALAIAALVAGRTLGWTWMDPISGIVGGFVILKWGFDLCRSAAFELLDVDTTSDLEQRIRAVLEGIDDVRVLDLHVWSLGRGARSCVVTLVSAAPREASEYRARILALGGISHLTVEVQRCIEGHGELGSAVRLAEVSS
jgi:cation diffusion facilitator family transporter